MVIGFLTSATHTLSIVSYHIAERSIVAVAAVILSLWQPILGRCCTVIIYNNKSNTIQSVYGSVLLLGTRNTGFSTFG